MYVQAVKYMYTANIYIGNTYNETINRCIKCNETVTLNTSFYL